MGLFYDGIRIFRRTVPHKCIWMQMEDGIFWTLAAILVSGVMLRASSGEIRLFSVFGLFGGMGLYFLSLSRLVVSLSYRIIRMIKGVLLLLFQIIWTPFRLFFLIFGVPLREIGIFCDRKKKKLLQSWRVYVKIKAKHMSVERRMFYQQRNSKGQEYDKKQKN